MEDNKFTKNLKILEVTPSNKWIQNTKKILEESINATKLDVENSVVTKNKFLRISSIENLILYFTNFQMQRLLLVLFLIITVSLSGVGIVYYNSNFSKKSVTLGNLTEAQKKEILTEISLNTDPVRSPLIQKINEQSKQETNNTKTEGLNKQDASLSAKPAMEGYAVIAPDSNVGENTYTYTRDRHFRNTDISDNCMMGNGSYPSSYISEYHSYNNANEGVYLFSYVTKTEDGKIINLNYQDENIGYGTKTEDGKIINLNSNSYDNKSSEYIQINYIGGEYAAKYVYSNNNNEPMFYTTTEIEPVGDDIYGTGMAEPVSYPTGYENTEYTNNDNSLNDIQEEKKSSPLEEYFGYEPDIINIETINGEDYYVVQSSYPYWDCGDFNKLDYSSIPDFWNGEDYPQYTEPTSTNNILSLQWVNVKDLSTYKSENYLNSVEKDNLIDSYTSEKNISTNITKEEATKLMYADIEKLEVKDMSHLYQTYYNDGGDYITKTIENVSDVINEKNITIPFIKKMDVVAEYYQSISSIYNPNYFDDTTAIENEYSDRKFYPEGKSGDEMFKSYNTPYEQIKQPYDIEVHVQTGSNYYNVDIFKNNEDISKVINSNIYLPVKNKTVTELEISTERRPNIKATLYDYEYDDWSYDNVNYDDSDVNNDMPTLITKKSFLIVLKLDGYNYLFKSDYMNEEFNKEDFEKYIEFTNDKKEIDSILEQYKVFMTGTNELLAYPTSF